MDEKKPEEGKTDESAQLTRDDVVTIVNQAITSHSKRQSSALEKTIADSIAKALEKKPADEPAPQEDKAKDTKSKVYEQQLADLKRRLDESETKAKRVEETARQERTQSLLRAQLEAVKVRPEMLDVVVGHLAKVTGALRYDDAGTPLLAVKRARQKGSAAEEMLFDDLKAGVDDWAKSDEAKPFLVPPAMPRPQGQQRRFEGAPSSEGDTVSRIVDLYLNHDK